MSRTENNIPAAIDSHTYVWPDAEGRLAGVLLARVDSRVGVSGYVHRYAPIALTVSGVDTSAAFWDTWEEVVRHRA